MTEVTLSEEWLEPAEGQCLEVNFARRTMRVLEQREDRMTDCEFAQFIAGRMDTVLRLMEHRTKNELEYVDPFGNEIKGSFYTVDQSELAELRWSLNKLQERFQSGEGKGKVTLSR